MSIFKVSQKAVQDLHKIGRYTEDHWGVDQRNRYLDDIDSRFKQLASTPNHLAAKDRGDIQQGCFSLSVNEHVIIFRKFRYSVRIVRVLHQSMDINRHL